MQVEIRPAAIGENEGIKGSPQGFLGESVPMAQSSRNRTFAISPVSERYGWGRGLSTAAHGREPVKEFIILTEFSRCQERSFK
jgi:hypothetical protein